MTEALQRTPEQESRPDLPRAYFASLSDYNHMVLHGAWVENLADVDHVHEEIRKMLDASQEAVAEEWALHDYEGFGDWSPSEYESIENLSRVAAGIEEHGPAFAAWVSYLGDAKDERLDDFEDAYRGNWSSMEAFAEEMIEDHGLNIYDGLPEWIASYVRIDFEMLGRDMAMDMHVTSDGSGGVWVFDPNV